MKRILITGGNGFFGSHLAAEFRRQGHDVAIAARRPRSAEERHFVLGQSVDVSLPAGFDLIVHTAHDVLSAERTTTGTCDLFQLARRCTPRPRQLFVGSYSARPDAVSEYGQVKYKLERVFLEGNEPVVRPGLILGNGSLFARNVHSIIRLPVIPLINGGRDEVPIVSVADAVCATCAVALSDCEGAWNLFHPVLPSMRGIVEEILAQTGLRRWVLPVPAPAAIMAVEFLLLVGFKAPFRPDNLRSLKANRTRVHDSHLEHLLGRPPHDLKKSVHDALTALGYIT